MLSHFKPMPDWHAQQSAGQQVFCAGVHHFGSGGVSKKGMDAMYRGRCCGGTKLPGDGNKWQCKFCPYKAFVCCKCRKELRMDEAQWAAVIEKKTAAQEKIAKSLKENPPGVQLARAEKRRAEEAEEQQLMNELESPEFAAMMEEMEKEAKKQRASTAR